LDLSIDNRIEKTLQKCCTIGGKFEKTIHQQIQQKGRRKPSRLRAAEKNCES